MPSSSSPWSSSLSVFVAVAGISILSSTAAAAVVWFRHRRNADDARKHHQEEIDHLIRKWKALRQEERTGRIRAEVKLRTLLKEREQLSSSPSLMNDSVEVISDEDRRNDNDGEKPKANTTMTMTMIGIIESPYTKRMGTPRQSALVPASRGRVRFCPQVVQPAMLDGIEEYSHIWILFEFHANTSTTVKKSKIRPPRAPSGVKVGVLATRSPHRPNQIGLSLVKVEHWDGASRTLHISGLDLVNGTPVYDIKPATAWDIPGYRGPRSNSVRDSSGDDASLTASLVPSVLHTPWWVQDDQDVLAIVEFKESALQSLHDAIEDGRLAPLYTNDNDGYMAATATLRQILAQDPRSSHKGLKANSRGTATTATSTTAATSSAVVDETYNLVFGKVRVDFVVDDTKRVQIVAINPIEFAPGSYVDGIPLIGR